MHTRLSQLHKPGRLALGLAMVALLFVLSLQVTEAGHLHILDDSAAPCLLCNNTAEAPLQSTPGFISPPGQPLPVSTQYADFYPVHITTRPPSRGPPLNS
jgi:hypothetical protein